MLYRDYDSKNQLRGRAHNGLSPSFMRYLERKPPTFYTLFSNFHRRDDGSKIVSYSDMDKRHFIEDLLRKCDSQ